jgi:hypothetical protein
MDIDLNPDGPHSPERTAEVAAIFDACSRFLVYATMGGAPGLDYPSEAYRLLGDLYCATGRLPQMCEQLREFLHQQEDGGRLGDDSDREVSVQVGIAGGALVTAAGHAAGLTRALQDAQRAINGLYVKPGAEGSDGNG